MANVGHFHAADGQSVFRVFAPGKRQVSVVLTERGEQLPLAADALGYWHGRIARLAPGTLYMIEVDGRRIPDPASRRQPHGVHGPSMVTGIEPIASPGWTGVAIEDAIIYELHVGTFTPEGTFAAAQERLAHLAELGVTVVELLPVAPFPGERNWGYDGVFPFGLHRAYGDYADLRAFIEAAHRHGIAVILDVVYNHFGPEGNYSGVLAPYTLAAETPWGAAINFDNAFNYGVREFFLEATRHWLQDVGCDGMRMDAVQFVFDQMPSHILREITDLARAIGRAQGREILMIAEHLRNNRLVTSAQGLNYHAQWNDDLNHAIFARLTGETRRHYANFGSFDDIVKALRKGFVLDGTRYDRYHHCFLGSDGGQTQATEHVVHIQNHDQVGNRPFGDRMAATYGTTKALLGITAVMASPFVPMLFMGEEYGETAPFLFFEDFGDPQLVDAVRAGRRADCHFGNAVPPDPHDRASFESSKLRWERLATPEGRAAFAYYRQLIALKRSGELGPRRFADVLVAGDVQTETITIETPHTVTVLNFAERRQPFAPPAGWVPVLASVPLSGGTFLEPFAALVLRRA